MANADVWSSNEDKYDFCTNDCRSTPSNNYPWHTSSSVNGSNPEPAL